MICIIVHIAAPLRRWVPVVALAVAALVGPRRAEADIIIMAQDVTVAAGASGASLDVTLTNTGPGSVSIGGFTLELTTGNAAITFTDVTTGTSSAPYIFDGLGLFGPSLGNVVNGQDIQASDVFSVVGSGTTIGSGATVGLGHLVFDVSSGASSSVNGLHIVAFPATSLSDFAGGDVPITTVTDGSITIRGTGVPEPASLGLVGSGLALSALAMARSRRRGGPRARGPRGRRA